MRTGFSLSSFGGEGWGEEAVSRAFLDSTAAPPKEEGGN
jgi:hypothetical protein